MQESGEMYLETIFVLSRRLDAVRSIDIASELGYSKPSISRAMKLLKAEGHIKVDEKSGSITLTPSGGEIAEKIYERHQVLTHVLMKLGVNAEIASDDACRIEHVISPETFDCIKAYLKK